MQYQNAQQKKPRLKPRLLIWGGAVVLGVGLLAALVMGSSGNPVPRQDVVSESAIHWHPELAIFVKGQKQEIPANTGIGAQYSKSEWYDSMMSMTDVHTHDSSGTLHWEVMDDKTPVTKDHVRLSVFFEIWGQPFNSQQILGYNNGPDGTVKMTVNGKSSTEFEKYEVRDKDKIEIRYE